MDDGDPTQRDPKEEEVQISLELSLSLVPSPSSFSLRNNNGVATTDTTFSLTAPPSPPRIFSAGASRRSNHANNVPRDRSKSLTIEPPFRWATDRRATVHTLEDIRRMGITSVEGRVQCRRCDHRIDLSCRLEENFRRVAYRIASLKGGLCSKAPPYWMQPNYRDCPSCLQPNCMKPVVEVKKRSINWLFMFLEETIGACKMSQLKYFSRYNSQHRTGSKGHLLLSVYVHIHKQLDPSA